MTSPIILIALIPLAFALLGSQIHSIRQENLVQRAAVLFGLGIKDQHDSYQIVGFFHPYW